MLRHSLCLRIVLAVGVVHIAYGQSEKRAEVDPAEWAPADAIAYLGITDIAQTWSDFKNTASYKLISDDVAGQIPGASVFRPLIKGLEERLAKMLDVDASQLRNPFAGPLTFYIAVPRGGKSEDLEPGLIAGIGDAALLRKYYDSAVGKLKEVAKHSTESAGTYTIDIFTRTDEPSDRKRATPEEKEDRELEELGPGAPPLGKPVDKLIDEELDEWFRPENAPRTLAACLTEERLIVAATPERVRAILRREKGRESLADTADHKDLLRHLKPLGTVHFQVDLPRVLELAKAETTSADEAKEFAEAVKILGAEGLRSLVGHVRVGASSYDMKMELLFLMSGERSGLAKILSMANQPVTPPAFVPADVCQYLSINLQPGPLMEEIERMARQSSPEAADSFRRMLEEIPLPSGQTINLRQEFIEHLTGPLTFILNFTQPLGPESPRLLLTLGHRDQSAMARFLGQLAPYLQSRELRGTQVFDLSIVPGVSIAAAPDRLVAGNASALESALQPASGPTLADTNGWRRAARHIPEQAWAVFYTDERAMLNTALEYAKNKELLAAGGMFNPAAFLLQQAYGPLLTSNDETQMKQFRKLLDYTSKGVLTAATTPQGVRLTFVTLRPED
jgi:hypothetical protein